MAGSENAFTTSPSASGVRRSSWSYSMTTLASGHSERVRLALTHVRERRVVEQDLHARVVPDDRPDLVRESRAIDRAFPWRR